MTKQICNPMEFAKRLKELRKGKGISSAKKLGELTYLGESTIKLYESGKRIPQHDNAKILADFYRVDIEYLYGNQPYKNRWEKYDTTHCEELEKISLDVRFLECCDFLGCDTSQLDEDQADELITTSYDFIISKYKEITKKGMEYDL